MKNQVLTSVGYQDIRVCVSILKGEVVIGIQDTTTGKIKHKKAKELANEPSKS